MVLNYLSEDIATAGMAYSKLLKIERAAAEIPPQRLSALVEAQTELEAQLLHVNGMKEQSSDLRRLILKVSQRS
jgi:hypothetical protein